MSQTERHLHHLFQSRRSIRRYLADPVPRILLESLLEAAAWAPSAHNRQPWRFMVVEQITRKERLARAMGTKLRHDLEVDGQPEAVIAADVGRSYERIVSAPVLILVCLTLADMDVYPDEQRAQNEFLMAVQSVAMAGQNLLLAAHAAGLGACWMCAPLFCPEVVKAALSVPEDWQPQGMITLGYPAQERHKTRAPLKDRVMWE